MRYSTHWLPLREAHAFIARHHRHHKPAQGGIVALGIYCPDNSLIGCGIIGRSVNRLQGPACCEITRSCLLDGHDHAASALLGRLRRVAQALGFERMVTYTLESEPGTSLRAAGWIQDELMFNPREWHTPARPRLPATYQQERRIRWWRSTEAQQELRLKP